jgi:RES domain-containing protein
VTATISIQHTHEPVLRVIRAGWANPLDASFSQTNATNRWNTNRFPALYCCCSESVAIAVAEDVLGYAGLNVSDLQPDYRPQKVEISWSGNVVDVISEEGIKAIGFPSNYPNGVNKLQTRALAEEWFESENEGVVCRSASLSAKGLTKWSGKHEQWSELAIYTSKAKVAPKFLSRSTLKLISSSS